MNTPFRTQITTALGLAMAPLVTPSRIAASACKRALEAEGPAALPLMIARVDIQQSGREIDDAIKALEVALDKAVGAVERLTIVTQTAVERLPADLQGVIESACEKAAKRMSGGMGGRVVAS